ncbi:hypothetical protein BGZ79_008501, partial [Entomortierella chlamydospora]
MALKSAKLEGFQVPSYRVNFVVSCTNYDMAPVHITIAQVNDVVAGQLVNIN